MLGFILLTGIVYGQETCPVDAFEENDTITQAPLVTLSTYSGLTICEDDADYYSVFVNSGDNILTELSFDNAEGDIDLFLLDSNLTEVAASTTIFDTETIDYYALTSGLYFIGVNLYEEAGETIGNTYDMVIDSYTMTPCLPDQLEENDDISSPSPLTPGAFPNLSACPEDEDWYTISLNEAEKINIDVAFNHLLGDIDIYFFSQNGTLISTSTTLTDNESIEFVPPVSGNYIFKIHMLTEGGLDFGNAYSLEIITEQLPICPEDQFEPNDSLEESTTTEPGSYTGLNSCNDDWYHLEVKRTQTLQVDLQFTHQQGDLDAELYSPDGTVVVTSNSVTDTETITHTADQDGKYAWKIILRSDSGSTGNLYQMDVALSELPDEVDTGNVDTGMPTSPPTSATPPVKEGCNTIPPLRLWTSFPLILLGIVLRRKNAI